MNLKKTFTAVAIFSYILISACQPNGDVNTTDADNSAGEGAIDTTRIPGFDSSYVPPLDATEPQNNDTLRQNPVKQ